MIRANAAFGVCSTASTRSLRWISSRSRAPGDGPCCGAMPRPPHSFADLSFAAGVTKCQRSAKIRREISAWRMGMAIPKRELGRTGLEVTVLGYGAMELRGAPRGRDVTEAQAETILNAVLDAGINYIDTSIDYGLSEERIGRYIVASALRILPGEQMRLPGRRLARSARAARPACLHPRQHPQGGRAEPRPDEDGLSRHRPVSRLAVEADLGGTRRARCGAGAQRGRQGAVHRHLRHPASPAGPYRDGRVRRLPDPLFGGRA